MPKKRYPAPIGSIKALNTASGPCGKSLLFRYCRDYSWEEHWLLWKVWGADRRHAESSPEGHKPIWAETLTGNGSFSHCVWKRGLACKRRTWSTLIFATWRWALGKDPTRLFRQPPQKWSESQFPTNYCSGSLCIVTPHCSQCEPRA